MKSQVNTLQVWTPSEKPNFLMKHKAYFLNICLVADLKGIRDNIDIIHYYVGKVF